MAGSGAKITGSLLFALGGIIVIAGAVMIGLLVNDQADNEQSGPFGLGEDQERSDQNIEEARMATLVMAIGALPAIGGIIAIAVGIGQRRGELKREWRQVKDQLEGISHAEVVAIQGDVEETEAPSWVRPAMIVGGVAAAIILITVIVVAAGVGGGGGLLGNGGDGDAKTFISNETIQHRLPAGASLGGISQNQPGGTARSFDAPAETQRLVARIDWTPMQTGVQQMRFIIEYDDAGTWTEIDRVLGGPGMELQIDSQGLPTALGALDLRFRAFPGDDGVTDGQDYSVDLAYFNK